MPLQEDYVFIDPIFGSNMWLRELIGLDPLRRGLRDRSGIGPIIFLVILFAAFLVTSMGALLVRSAIFRSLDVSDAYWSISGQRVQRAKVGELVSGHIVVHSWGRFDGDIVLRIRLDVKLWLDKDVATQRFHVTFRPGESREFTLSFRPSQASVGEIGGYFIEVDFGFIRGRWTMPSSYPPRLVVTV